MTKQRNGRWHSSILLCALLCIVSPLIYCIAEDDTAIEVHSVINPPPEAPLSQSSLPSSSSSSDSIASSPSSSPAPLSSDENDQKLNEEYQQLQKERAEQQERVQLIKEPRLDDPALPTDGAQPSNTKSHTKSTENDDANINIPPAVPTSATSDGITVDANQEEGVTSKGGSVTSAEPSAPHAIQQEAKQDRPMPDAGAATLTKSENVKESTQQYEPKYSKPTDALPVPFVEPENVDQAAKAPLQPSRPDSDAEKQDQQQLLPSASAPSQTANSAQNPSPPATPISANSPLSNEQDKQPTAAAEGRLALAPEVRSEPAGAMPETDSKHMQEDLQKQIENAKQQHVQLTRESAPAPIPPPVDDASLNAPGSSASTTTDTESDPSRTPLPAANPASSDHAPKSVTEETGREATAVEEEPTETDATPSINESAFQPKAPSQDPPKSTAGADAESQVDVGAAAGVAKESTGNRDGSSPQDTKPDPPNQQQQEEASFAWPSDDDVEEATQPPQKQETTPAPTPSSPSKQHEQASDKEPQAPRDAAEERSTLPQQQPQAPQKQPEETAQDPKSQMGEKQPEEKTGPIDSADADGAPSPRRTDTATSPSSAIPEGEHALPSVSKQSDGWPAAGVETSDEPRRQPVPSEPSTSHQPNEAQEQTSSSPHPATQGEADAPDAPQRPGKEAPRYVDDGTPAGQTGSPTPPMQRSGSTDESKENQQPQPQSPLTEWADVDEDDSDIPTLPADPSNTQPERRPSPSSQTTPRYEDPLDAKNRATEESVPTTPAVPIPTPPLPSDPTLSSHTPTPDVPVVNEEMGSKAEAEVEAERPNTPHGQHQYPYPPQPSSTSETQQPKQQQQQQPQPPLDIGDGFEPEPKEKESARTKQDDDKELRGPIAEKESGVTPTPKDPLPEPPQPIPDGSEMAADEKERTAGVSETNDSKPLPPSTPTPTPPPPPGTSDLPTPTESGPVCKLLDPNLSFLTSSRFQSELTQLQLQFSTTTSSSSSSSTGFRRTCQRPRYLKIEYSAEPLHAPINAEDEPPCIHSEIVPEDKLEAARDEDSYVLHLPVAAATAIPGLRYHWRLTACVSAPNDLDGSTPSCDVFASGEDTIRRPHPYDKQLLSGAQAAHPPPLVVQLFTTIRAPASSLSALTSPTSIDQLVKDLSFVLNGGDSISSQTAEAQADMKMWQRRIMAAIIEDNQGGQPMVRLTVLPVPTNSNGRGAPNTPAHTMSADLLADRLRCVIDISARHSTPQLPSLFGKTQQTLFSSLGVVRFSIAVNPCINPSAPECLRVKGQDVQAEEGSTVPTPTTTTNPTTPTTPSTTTPVVPDLDKDDDSQPRSGSQESKPSYTQPSTESEKETTTDEDKWTTPYHPLPPKPTPPTTTPPSVQPDESDNLTPVTTITPKEGPSVGSEEIVDTALTDVPRWSKSPPQPQPSALDSSSEAEATWYDSFNINPVYIMLVVACTLSVSAWALFVRGGGTRNSGANHTLIPPEPDDEVDGFDEDEELGGVEMGTAGKKSPYAPVSTINRDETLGSSVKSPTTALGSNASSGGGGGSSFTNEKEEGSAIRFLTVVLMSLGIPSFGCAKYTQQLKDNYLSTLEQLKSLDGGDWKRLGLPLVIEDALKKSLQEHTAKEGRFAVGGGASGGSGSGAGEKRAKGLDLKAAKQAKKSTSSKNKSQASSSSASNHDDVPFILTIDDGNGDEAADSKSSGSKKSKKSSKSKKKQKKPSLVLSPAPEPAGGAGSDPDDLLDDIDDWDKF